LRESCSLSKTKDAHQFSKQQSLGHSFRRLGSTFEYKQLSFPSHFNVSRKFSSALLCL
jgi:hypothetical protein